MEQHVKPEIKASTTVNSEDIEGGTVVGSPQTSGLDEIFRTPTDSSKLKHTSRPLSSSPSVSHENANQSHDASTNQPNLDNPLQLFENDAEIAKAIEDFAGNHGLSHDLDTLLLVGRVLKDKEEALKSPDFPEEVERELRNENKTSFLSQSKSLKAAVIVVGPLAGICQGWTQSVLAVTAPWIFAAWKYALPKESSRPCTSSPVPKDPEVKYWAYGALSASALLAAGILSPFIADPIQTHYLGRRGAIAVSATISIAATIASVCCNNLASLIVCRVVIGACLGAKSSIIAPFLGELAPFHLRGAILSSWQVNVALGIFLGFVVGYIFDVHTSLDDNVKWRIVSASTIFPTFALLCTAYLIPESYIFLMKTREYRKAAGASCLYQRSRIQGMRDFLFSHFQMLAEAEFMKLRKQERRARRQKPIRHIEDGNGPPRNDLKSLSYLPATKPIDKRLSGPPGLCRERQNNKSTFRKSSNGPTRYCPHEYHMKNIHFFKRLKQIFTDTRCRHAFYASALVMLTQAICGINAFAFFASSVYEDANLQPTALRQSFGVIFGGTNFLFGLLAYRLSDRYGRTTLFLVGLPIQATLIMILACVFFVNSCNDGRPGAIMTMTLLFTAVYSFTVGPAAYALAAESFPAVVREAGMALSVFVNLTALGVFLMVYNFVLAKTSYQATLGISAAINLLAFVACYLICIDTNGRRLDELQYSFELPILLHCEYRLSYVLPYRVKQFRRFTSRLFTISIKRRRLEESEPSVETESRESDSMDQNSAECRERPLLAFHHWARVIEEDRPTVSERIRAWLGRQKSSNKEHSTEDEKASAPPEAKAEIKHGTRMVDSSTQTEPADVYKG